MTPGQRDAVLAYARRATAGGNSTRDHEQMADLLPELVTENRDMERALGEAQAEVRRLSQHPGWAAAHAPRFGW